MRNILLIFLIFSSQIGLAQNKKISLSNGSDLTGWKINGTEKWYVENGELVCESGPDKQYGCLLYTSRCV